MLKLCVIPSAKFHGQYKHKAHTDLLLQGTYRENKRVHKWLSQVERQHCERGSGKEVKKTEKYKLSMEYILNKLLRANIYQTLPFLE